MKFDIIWCAEVIKRLQFKKDLNLFLKSNTYL